jgi:hypothetical protein
VPTTPLSLHGTHPAIIHTVEKKESLLFQNRQHLSLPRRSRELRLGQKSGFTTATRLLSTLRPLAFCPKSQKPKWFRSRSLILRANQCCHYW